MSHRPREACGVFGVCAPGRDVARLAFFGLFAIQHRGQESTGIATSDGTATHLHKGMGLVSQVFNEENLAPLVGHLAIGHTRYSTTGSSNLRNAQPYLIETLHGPLGVAHNGNLTNAGDLRRLLMERGVGLSSSSDSEVITQLLASPPEVWMGAGTRASDDPWVDRLRALMHRAEGAYALAVLTRGAVYAVRDAHGLRPLCLGVLPEGGHLVSSESCALLTVGAHFLREVEPGEIVRLDAEGLTSFRGCPAAAPSLCVFEHVYFSRPDSVLGGRAVHLVRQRLGRQLAREAPAEADVVVGVPDSALPAAIGYSLESGIPFMEGLTKNRYIGRTFIAPDENLRKAGVHLKYNPLHANLEGRRVVLVDDSIVRGTTSGPLVGLLREGGATEVHVRISSPPVRHPCFMGVDMTTYEELIAHRMDPAEICERIGADSLGYLSLEGMLEAVADGPPGPGSGGHCAACFSGEYPVPIPEQTDKGRFEEVWYR